MSKQGSLADRVRVLRRKLRISQEALAIRADVSTSVIAKIEMGKSSMPRCIVEVAKALEVTPGWLLFNESDAGGPSDRLSDEARLLAERWEIIKEPYKSRINELVKFRSGN